MCACVCVSVYMCVFVCVLNHNKHSKDYELNIKGMVVEKKTLMQNMWTLTVFALSVFFYLSVFPCWHS